MPLHRPDLVHCQNHQGRLANDLHKFLTDSTSLCVDVGPLKGCIDAKGKGSGALPGLESAISVVGSVASVVSVAKGTPAMLGMPGLPTPPVMPKATAARPSI